MGEKILQDLQMGILRQDTHIVLYFTQTFMILPATVTEEHISGHEPHKAKME